MRSQNSQAIKIPISIKIPIKVVKFDVALIVKEVKIKSFEFWRWLKTSLALILGVLLVISSLPVLSAYEAHVVSVTAIIDPPAVTNKTFLLAGNNLLDASSTDSNLASNISIVPTEGAFCNDKSIEVSLATTLPDAQIIYTLDGSEPVCGINGYVYDKPFFLSESTTVKASTCLLDQQGVIASWNFDFSENNCSDSSAIVADNLSAPLETTILIETDSTSTQTVEENSNATTTDNSQSNSGDQGSGEQISQDQQPVIEPAPAIETQPTAVVGDTGGDNSGAGGGSDSGTQASSSDTAPSE